MDPFWQIQEKLGYFNSQHLVTLFATQRSVLNSMHFGRGDCFSTLI